MWCQSWTQRPCLNPLVYSDSGSINPLQELQIIEQMKVAGSHRRDRDRLFCWLVSCVWHACLCKRESGRIFIGFQKRERAGYERLKGLVIVLFACVYFLGFNEHSGGSRAPIRQKSLPLSAALRQARFSTARLSCPPNQMRGTWWRCWKAQPLNNWCLDKCGVNLSSGTLWVKLCAWSAAAGGNKCSPNFIYLILKTFLECSSIHTKQHKGLSEDHRLVVSTHAVRIKAASE